MHLHDAPTLFSLIPFARANRQKPTRSEALLWHALRGSKLGARFRRQHPLGGAFIVDFCCTTHRLVIEVDGGVHREAKQWQRDVARQRIIEALGYRVVRIEAELVERDVVAAVAVVRAALR